MSDKPENPPAYPTIGNVAYEQEWQTEHGMTLRDYFAGQALAGLLSSPNFRESLEGEPSLAGKTFGDVTSSFAYEHADAMLKERAK